MSTKHMLTVHELADLLQVSYKTALQVMKKNIPYIKVEGQYRIHPREVNKFIKSSANL